MCNLFFVLFKTNFVEYETNQRDNKKIVCISKLLDILSIFKIKKLNKTQKNLISKSIAQYC